MTLRHSGDGGWSVAKAPNGGPGIKRSCPLVPPGGSVIWGQVATLFGIPLALASAAVGGVIGIFATQSFRIGEHEGVDLAPSMHWLSPLVSESPEMDRGPIMVMVECHISPDTSDEFVKAMGEMRRIRSRDGAFFWGLFTDSSEATRYVEYFMVGSWAEHMRQHERVTVADRELEERVRSYHLGDRPPVVSHLVSKWPLKNMETRREGLA